MCRAAKIWACSSEPERFLRGIRPWEEDITGYDPATNLQTGMFSIVGSATTFAISADLDPVTCLVVGWTGSPFEVGQFQKAIVVPVLPDTILDDD